MSRPVLGAGPSGPLTIDVERLVVSRLLAQRTPARLTRSRWGTLARLRPKGSTFSSYLTKLRTAGYIDQQGDLFGVTDAGIKAAGHLLPAPQSSQEVVAMWKSVLGSGPARLIDVIVEAGREGIDREMLAARVDLTAGGSTLSSYLSLLRRNELVRTSDGMIWAAEVLLDGAVQEARS